MSEQKLPATLRMRLKEAEAKINDSMPPYPNWKRGVLTAILTCVAFFAFGLLAQAPVFSCLGFSLIGAVVGLLVGAYRKPGQDVK